MKKKLKKKSSPESQDVSPDLLNGLTIVLTGVMVNLAREKLEAWICEHGGRCTGSVSGKTNILITGSKLEDGREVTQGNKYRTAKAKGTTIYTEVEFENYIRELSGVPNFDFSMRSRGLLD